MKMFENFLLWYFRFFPLEYGKNYVRAKMKVKIDNLTAVENKIYVNSLEIKFLINKDDRILREIFLNDFYEKNTYKNLLRFLTPSSIIFDVGANVGAFTLLFGKICSKGHVYAFEPNPFCVSILKNHIDLNGLQNISVLDMGLSDRQESATLKYSMDSLSVGSVYRILDKFDLSSEIDLITLDQFVKDNKINKIDLIKVDVEGGELRFLSGARESINHFKPVIIMECDWENSFSSGYDVSELFLFLKQLNYNAYIPKSWPFGLVRVDYIPRKFTDNIFFIYGK